MIRRRTKTKKLLLAAIPLAAAAVLVWKSGWLPRPTSQEPKGLHSIRVPAGFRVEAAVTPGLVNYPMLGTIAPDGVLYICESSGRTMKTPEMTADPNYVVSRLVDTDGDGVYDTSTTFAAKLTLPAGAVWYRGSLYVAAPPQLYRFADTDNDGVADVREVVVEGWNLSANAASLHGPFLGPDGWLYLTDGRHGFKIRTRDGRSFEGKASRIWRVRPDGTGLEEFAGGGFDNPVEVVFTEAGDMFGTMTYFQDPANGQRDAILHFVEGGVYPKPHPAMEEFQRTGDLMPVMTKFARIAPSGLLRYRGGSFGGQFQGNLFSAQFNAHRVGRHKVRRQGTTFETDDEDFFVSSDPDLHPTDVMEDADGSLLVIDTGAWFIHGCPLSRSAKPDVKGMLYRVRRNGTAVADARGEKIEAWSADLLDDPRPFVHDKAVETLVEAGRNSVSGLALMRTRAGTLRGASSAVFALARIGTPDALREVREALADSRAEVRQAAARMAGMTRDAMAVPALIEMLGKNEPFVRRQAAAALGQIGDKRAAGALLEAAVHPADRFLEHSIIYSLIQLADAPALLAALSHSSPAVRKASLIALDQMRGSPIRASHALGLLASKEAELRRAALWVISRHAAWSPELALALESRLRQPHHSESEAALIGEAMVTFCGGDRMKTVIAGALGGTSLDAERQTLLIEAVERCPLKEFPDAWNAGILRLLAHSRAEVRVRAAGLIRARGLTSFDSRLRELAEASDQPDEARIAALSALSPRLAPLPESHFRYMIGRVSPKVEASVKLAAAQLLGRSRFTESQLVEIARRHLAEADPLVLPNLLDAFRGPVSEEAGFALIQALERIESSLGTVGEQRVKQIAARLPAAVQSLAKPLLGRMESGRSQRLKRLANLQSVLAARGDANKGREIFFGSKSGCGGCHTIGVTGGNVGPDLTSIGAIRSPHDLLEAIILPSESFVPGHEVYRVETAAEVYSGVLGKNTPEAVLLITGPGDEVRIPRKDIRKMGHAPVSLMPEGYEDVLSRTELTDLIAFLRSQTSRDVARAGLP